MPRTSGVLLHVTSLPGPFGIGDLGPEAHRFVDWLAGAGQRVWQVLPLVPVGLGHSPYSSPSTFAGNPALVSPERLVEDGWLEAADLDALPRFPAGRVDFERVIPAKLALLRRAYERFAARATPAERAEVDAFAEQHADWLDDYALFMALKKRPDAGSWTDWDRPLALRQPRALAAARREFADEIAMRRFWQFLFWRQWEALRTHARARGVRLLGDVPIYVAHDSADVWAHPDLFELDEAGQPLRVAGVPPDYFSETGQRWGNPLYRWDRLEADGFAWWVRRLEHTLRQMDLVRLDHFRGFEAYWAIPAGEETAVNGEWVEAPGRKLFEALTAAFGKPLPLVAEDLGLITPAVTKLKDRFGMAGMAVLPFGLSGDPASEHLPHNYAPRTVAYTGTHDNDTFVGWFENGASRADRRFTRAYLGLGRSRKDLHWAAIRAVMASAAEMAVIPVQDVLGLGSEARMNTPGSEDGNWGWRVAPGALSDDVAERLREATHLYGRLPPTPPTPTGGTGSVDGRG